MGSGGNDREAFWNARNTNIQETADHDAKEKKEERNHSFDCATGVAMPQSTEHPDVSDA
jgi:hypothetical protein